MIDLRFLVVLCCLQAAFGINPKISFISGPEIVKDIGESVQLECRVENGKEYPINWIKIRGDRGPDQEYLPLSTGKTLAVRDDRIKLVYEASTSSYSLSITEIKDIDAAKYQCQVIVGINNKITKEVTLQVRLPAKIVSEDPEDQVVIEGEGLALTCPVEGFPRPRVEWKRKDGRPLPGTTQTSHVGESLRVAKARKEDAGHYMCTGSNNVGEPVSKLYDLKVRFAPQISVPRPRIQQALRYGVTLTCNIEAYPTPAISWFKDETEMTTGGDFVINHFAKTKSLTVSTLKIYSIHAENFGMYTCKASNAHGEISEDLELVKTRMPIPEAAYGSGSRLAVVHAILVIAVTHIFFA